MCVDDDRNVDEIVSFDFVFIDPRTVGFVDVYDTAVVGSRVRLRSGEWSDVVVDDEIKSAIFFVVQNEFQIDR